MAERSRVLVNVPFLCLRTGRPKIALAGRRRAISLRRTTGLGHLRENTIRKSVRMPM